jgi:hypothetical protein
VLGKRGGAEVSAGFQRRGSGGGRRDETKTEETRSRKMFILGYR